MYTKGEEAKKEIESGKLAVVMFSTTGCPDCTMMQPVVKKAVDLLEEEGIKANLIQVNAEEANMFRDENAEGDVMKVPSFFAVKDGKKNHIGYEYLPAELIVEKVKEIA